MSYKTLIEFIDADKEKAFLGPLNKNISIINQELNIKIMHVSNSKVDALVMEEDHQFGLCQAVVNLLSMFYDEKINYQERDIIYIINLLSNTEEYEKCSKEILSFYQHKKIILNTFDGKKIVTKTLTQQKYLKALENNDVVFVTGSAGTGKTYLAVAYSVNALKNNDVRKIIITRPAVEAGEKLGFLPGDLKEKVDPYLIPIYDSLYEFLGKDTVDKLIEKGIIEIAPLAYMRGRTLDNAIVILDEGQNATSNQMKMFITRLGFNSKMIITGDITQIDLPSRSLSGLVEAIHILTDIPSVTHVEFKANDVMRHPIVSKIIEKYEAKNDKI